MNGEHLLRYLGHIDDSLVQECCAAVPQRPKRWKNVLAAAACVCLVLGSTLGVLIKLGYFSAGCGGWPGTIVNGVYYYQRPHSGAWCYTPGGSSKKLVSSLFMDGWLVNENGLYYDSGRSLYRKDLVTGKVQRLYTASWWECSHIGFSLEEDGSVVLTVYDKYKERLQQLLLDGMTGTVLRELSGWIDYSGVAYGESNGYQMYEYCYYTSGEDTYELVYTTDLNGDPSADLQLDGVSVLPQGWYLVFRPVLEDMNGNLLAELYTGRKSDYWQNHRILLIRADGSRVLLDEYHNYEACTPDGRYLFYQGTTTDAQGNTVQTDVLHCMDAETGQSWPLPMDASTPQYSLTADGTHVYTSAPWADEQACWRIVYDEAGRPSALTLITADLHNAGR